MNPESKTGRILRHTSKLGRRLWHLAWIIWHETGIRSAERDLNHNACKKHRAKQDLHIEKIEATFPQTTR